MENTPPLDDYQGWMWSEYWQGRQLVDEIDHAAAAVQRIHMKFTQFYDEMRELGMHVGRELDDGKIVCVTCGGEWPCARNE